MRTLCVWIALAVAVLVVRINAQGLLDVTALTKSITNQIQETANAVNRMRLKKEEESGKVKEKKKKKKTKRTRRGHMRKKKREQEEEERSDNDTEDRFRSGFIPEESQTFDSSVVDTVVSKSEKGPVDDLPSESKSEKVPVDDLPSEVDFPTDDSSPFGGSDTMSSSESFDNPTHRKLVDLEMARSGSGPPKSGNGRTVITFQGDQDEYCEKYEQHFSFYCVGDVDHTEQAKQVLEHFCPSYKKSCPDRSKGTSVPLTTWPANPFSKEISVNKEPSDNSEEEDESNEDSPSRLTKDERYVLYLRRRVPCKPECNEKIYPHCTTECKCDYIYPSVQKFCNPPPMPLFLNTCRMWYNGCPKYERYHYASQFMYSKAEKGKVLPGPKPINPQGIPQPAGLGFPSRVRGSPTYDPPVSSLMALNHEHHRKHNHRRARKSKENARFTVDELYMDNKKDNTTMHTTEERMAPGPDMSSNAEGIPQSMAPTNPTMQEPEDRQPVVSPARRADRIYLRPGSRGLDAFKNTLLRRN